MYTVSPPPQQVEEDDDYVQVDRESSVDVFLWIQPVAHPSHHQLTVDHQELKNGDLKKTALLKKNKEQIPFFKQCHRDLLRALHFLDFYHKLLLC